MLSIDFFEECEVTQEKVEEFKSCVDTLHNVKVFVELTKNAVTNQLKKRLGLNPVEQKDEQVEDFNKFVEFCDLVLKNVVAKTIIAEAVSCGNGDNMTVQIVDVTKL